MTTAPAAPAPNIKGAFLVLTRLRQVLEEMIDEDQGIGLENVSLLDLTELYSRLGNLLDYGQGVMGLVSKEITRKKTAIAEARIEARARIPKPSAKPSTAPENVYPFEGSGLSLTRRPDGTVELVDRPLLCYRCKKPFPVAGHYLRSGDNDVTADLGPGMRCPKCGYMNRHSGHTQLLNYEGGRRIRTVIGGP